MPQLRSQTHDNCRVPLNGTQFFGMPPKDLQGTIDNHHPFEITVYTYINHTNLTFLKNQESYRNFGRVLFEKWTKTPCIKT